jgi:hypothetical protein
MRECAVQKPARSFLVAAAIVLCWASLAPKVHAGPWGLGRPPGFGPEMDRTAIARFQELQQFLVNELGYKPCARPGQSTVRDGVLHRNFLGAWRLDDRCAGKFKVWMSRLYKTPGIQVLGIIPEGMDYLMTDMNAEYAGSNDLGDYWLFNSSAAALRKLASDCDKLYRMAQGYVDKLQARLKFEAENGGSVDSGGTANHKPITILDVMGKDGRAQLNDMMQERLRRKDIK